MKAQCIECDTYDFVAITDLGRLCVTCYKYFVDELNDKAVTYD